MKKILSFLILALSANNLLAQENILDHSYDRIALTVVFIDNPNSAIPGNIRQSAIDFYKTSSVVPDKYDNHDVPTKVIQVRLPSSPYETVDISDIEKEVVYQERIPTQMIEKWFNRSTAGIFNMELIKERGRYNATDNDYLNSVAEQRQKSVLEDMGEKLLQKSYLLLINYTEIATGKNANDKLYYQGSAKAYLFRLNWDETTSQTFYNDFWINESDDDATRAQKREKFNNANFSVKYVNTINVTKSQALTILLGSMSDMEKLTLLNAQLSEGIIEKLVTADNKFNIKDYIVSSDPVSAKIGTKEGLYTDQRFYVMETRTNNQNILFDKRIGVIRVKKIANNKSEAQGNTNASEFYQVGGGKIDSYGMFLKEKRDLGLSFSVYQLFGGIGGPEVSCTYHISRILSKFFSSNVPTGLNIYGEIGMVSENYEDVAYDGWYNYNFNRFSFGLHKDIYFGKKFHNSYKIGYGFESTELTGNLQSKIRLDLTGNLY